MEALMAVRVVDTAEGHRLEGEGAVAEAANGFLKHLGTRGYSPATVRAYAFDVANFATFLADRGLELAEVVPSPDSSVARGVAEIVGVAVGCFRGITCG